MACAVYWSLTLFDGWVRMASDKAGGSGLLDTISHVVSLHSIYLPLMVREAYHNGKPSILGITVI